MADTLAAALNTVLAPWRPGGRHRHPLGRFGEDRRGRHRPGHPGGAQGAIFQRFYREAAVHDVEGVGLGLFLTREIVTRQGAM